MELLNKTFITPDGKKHYVFQHNQAVGDPENPTFPETYGIMILKDPSQGFSNENASWIVYSLKPYKLKRVLQNPSLLSLKMFIPRKKINK